MHRSSCTEVEGRVTLGLHYRLVVVPVVAIVRRLLTVGAEWQRCRVVEGGLETSRELATTVAHRRAVRVAATLCAAVRCAQTAAVGRGDRVVGCGLVEAGGARCLVRVGRTAGESARAELGTRSVVSGASVVRRVVAGGAGGDETVVVVHATVEAVRGHVHVVLALEQAARFAFS